MNLLHGPSVKCRSPSQPSGIGNPVWASASNTHCAFGFFGLGAVETGSVVFLLCASAVTLMYILLSPAIGCGFAKLLSINVVLLVNAAGVCHIANALIGAVSLTGPLLTELGVGP